MCYNSCHDIKHSEPNYVKLKDKMNEKNKHPDNKGVFVTNVVESHVINTIDLKLEVWQ